MTRKHLTRIWSYPESLLRSLNLIVILIIFNKWEYLYRLCNYVSYQLCWCSHTSSFEVSTVSVFDTFFSFLIRISCLTVFSSLKLTEVSQLTVVSNCDCRRLRFLIMDLIRWKLLSSLEPSPTSYKI